MPATTTFRLHSLEAFQQELEEESTKSQSICFLNILTSFQAIMIQQEVSMITHYRFLRLSLEFHILLLMIIMIKCIIPQDILMTWKPLLFSHKIIFLKKFASSNLILMYLPSEMPEMMPCITILDSPVYGIHFLQLLS